jgi:hypothetical protein
MKRIKCTFILTAITLWSMTAFSQVSLNVRKPLSSEDQKVVTKILSQMDPKSYSINVDSENGGFKAGNLKGLADVKQGETTRPKEHLQRSKIRFIHHHQHLRCRNRNNDQHLQNS